MNAPIPATADTSVKKPLEEAKKACEEVSHIPPGNTHEMGSKLQKMILDYYADVRKQAQQSFYAALIIAFVGTGFFMYAVKLSMDGNKNANISLIAGCVIQVISALNFFLYSKTSRQFSSFHICLERTNRFLLANTLCDNLSCQIKKDNTRIELIQTMMDAPMLTMDIINEGQAKESAQKPKPVYLKTPEFKVENLYS